MPSRRGMNILSIGGNRTCWNGTINHTCCPFLLRSSFHSFKIMETIPSHPNNRPKTCGLSFSRYDPRDDLYIFVVAKRNRRTTSTSPVALSIGKTISAITVHRRLQMNGRYVRVSRVCVPLSLHFKWERLYLFRSYINWSVFVWSNGGGGWSRMSWYLPYNQMTSM